MLDKRLFLEEFHLEEIFERSGIVWENLVEIYDDYTENHYEELKKSASVLVGDLETKRSSLPKDTSEKIHTIFGRAKDPKHLIEKIVRKIGSEDSQKYRNINRDNYREIITDLIGVRVLVLAKEDWKAADDLVRMQFQKFEEKPIAYVCYGDREIFDPERLYVEYTSKGYRSQHYIVRYNGSFAEIQARTLSEEVYGEFDHRVRYPYRIQNKFLRRYSGIVSKNASEMDDLISSCLDIDETLLEQLDHHFIDDRYVEWVKRQVELDHGDEAEKILKQETIRDAKDLVLKKMALRKEY